MSACPRIEIRALTKTYRRENGDLVRPVDNIDMVVDDNEIVVLLGPSGCGKTTLLRCVAGLERPDSGEILINGQVVFSSRDKIFLPPEKAYGVSHHAHRRSQAARRTNVQGRPACVDSP